MAFTRCAQYTSYVHSTFERWFLCLFQGQGKIRCLASAVHHVGCSCLFLAFPGSGIVDALSTTLLDGQPFALKLLPPPFHSANSFGACQAHAA
eukprot:1147314-Pelagomonas_calceolata.AAC.7